MTFVCFEEMSKSKRRPDIDSVIEYIGLKPLVVRESARVETIYEYVVGVRWKMHLMKLPLSHNLNLWYLLWTAVALVFYWLKRFLGFSKFVSL